jgi:hypothetical protein
METRVTRPKLVRGEVAICTLSLIAELALALPVMEWLGTSLILPLWEMRRPPMKGLDLISLAVSMHTW